MSMCRVAFHCRVRAASSGAGLTAAELDVRSRKNFSPCT